MSPHPEESPDQRDVEPSAPLRRLSAARTTLTGWARSARRCLEARLPILQRRPAILPVTLALVGLTLSFGLYLAVDVLVRLPDPHELSSLDRMPEATLVYDAFDQPAFTIFREQRLRVPLEQVSARLLDAVLAIEDQRFYQHRGIDLVRVLGATAANVSAGRIVEGGSTITQQLARQALLSTERSFGRKLAEVLTALWIEHTYEKQEILELYLNEIYFGSGLYGVETAARGYFGKPAAELDVSEAALLAGLIQAPERYSPTRFPERAIARRNAVLQVLLKERAIDRREHDQARRDPLSLENGLQGMEPHGSYFKEEVRRQLIEMFGWDVVYEQGLRVESTIDPDMQRAAEETLEEGIREIEARRAYRHPPRGSEDEPTISGELDYLQGALIALDPVSGEVRALVGGRYFADSPFNRATQARRQPGSAFKPIVYAAALEHGITPITVLDDLNEPVPAAEGAWLPAEGQDDVSALTVRAALQVSSNRAAVHLMRVTGIDSVLDYAERFGLGRQPRVPSVALGSGSVTLESLTGAYAAFANRGMVPQPISYIRRVTDVEGNVLFEAAPPGERIQAPAVRPATAFIVSSLLRSVLDAGTGWRVRREGFRAPAAGKTGTTDDTKDAWFIGFTPGLAAGVWIGFDEPRTIVPRGYGADLAAPVWARFMSEVAGKEDSAGWLEPPADVVAVEVCASSLALATEACRRAKGDASGGAPRPQTYVEYFASGTEPVDRCRDHGSIFATLIAPFRSPSSSDRQPSEAPPAPPEPPPPIANTMDAPTPSVPVVHDHVFGNCTGRLVAGPQGLRYVTEHKDAFRLRFAELAGVTIDVERQRIRVSVRRGKNYNFHAASVDRDALAALEAALDAQ